jgi:hypothetical protein
VFRRGVALLKTAAFKVDLYKTMNIMVTVSPTLDVACGAIRQAFELVKFKQFASRFGCERKTQEDSGMYPGRTVLNSVKRSSRRLRGWLSQLPNESR